MRLARAAYERCVLLSGLALLAGLCLAWTPLALLLSLVLPRAAGRRIGRRAIRTGCAFYLRALAATGTCRFDLAALEALDHEGPLIIAPNHPGLLDAVLVLSRLRDVSCIAKGPLLRSPLFGAGARLAGYLSNASPLGMAVQAADELHGGGKLLLFPEGTRTVRPPVNPLKAAVGVIAARAAVPVQAVIIETDTRFLGKGWPLTRQPTMPMHWRIRLGRRFAPPTDTRAFLVELERHFASELASGLAPDDATKAVAEPRSRPV